MDPDDIDKTAFVTQQGFGSVSSDTVQPVL